MLQVHDNTGIFLLCTCLFLSDIMYMLVDSKFIYPMKLFLSYEHAHGGSSVWKLLFVTCCPSLGSS